MNKGRGPPFGFNHPSANGIGFYNIYNKLPFVMQPNSLKPMLNNPENMFNISKNNGVMHKNYGLPKKLEKQLQRGNYNINVQQIASKMINNISMKMMPPGQAQKMQKELAMTLKKWENIHCHNVVRVNDISGAYNIPPGLFKKEMLMLGLRQKRKERPELQSYLKRNPSTGKLFFINPNYSLQPAKLLNSQQQEKSQIIKEIKQRVSNKEYKCETAGQRLSRWVNSDTGIRQSLLSKRYASQWKITDRQYQKVDEQTNYQELELGAFPKDSRFSIYQEKKQVERQKEKLFNMEDLLQSLDRGEEKQSKISQIPGGGIVVSYLDFTRYDPTNEIIGYAQQKALNLGCCLENQAALQVPVYAQSNPNGEDEPPAEEYQSALNQSQMSDLSHGPEDEPFPDIEGHQTYIN